MAFNPTDRKYTVCCCCRSVVVATIFSTLETIFIGIKLYHALNHYFQTMDNPSITTVLTTILFAVLWTWNFAAMVCIYVSIYRPHPNYVLPKLTLVVVELVLLILSAIGIIIYFSGAARATNEAILGIFEYAAAAALGVIVLSTVYNIWFLLVMRTYYRFVKDKAAAGQEAALFQPLATAPPPPPPYNPRFEK
uniref:MARVEL domain-containing protein n=1 Tax=Plectus sambesii TaxID=2011161 RepID=A0A914XTC7_9BILA